MYVYWTELACFDRNAPKSGFSQGSEFSTMSMESALSNQFVGMMSLKTEYGPGCGEGKLHPAGQLRSRAARRRCSPGAYTLLEVVFAVTVLGVLSVGLFGAFSSGLITVQSSREDTRAAQILMQKMEAVRLLTWSQGTNTVVASTNFTDYYDPTGNSQTMGALYQGFYSPSAAPSSIPADYRDSMRLVTVTVYWTNYTGNAKPKVETRQMQTYVARYGMQNYVFQ